MNTLNSQVVPSFEVEVKHIMNKGLASCWYCENLCLLEETRKVSVNQKEEDMCLDCYDSFLEK